MEKADNIKQWQSQKQRQKAVNYLNRLNQTQLEKITEFLSTKLSINYEKTNKRKT